MSSTKEQETVETQVDVEHYERLWKIKGLPSAMEVENPDVEIVTPLEIETSADSALHSKWIIAIGKGSDENEIAVACTLQTIYNEDIKKIQSQLTCGFRSGVLSHKNGLDDQFTRPGGFLELDWFKPPREKWDRFLETNGEAIVYIKLSLFNVHTPEVMEIKLKRQLIVNARKNVALLLCGDHTQVDLKIVSSDGKEIKCHQEMLKANSPVFKTMLESGFFEGTSGIINVTDISGVTMELLVQFMYTGRLPETWRQPEITLELTYAAGKYDMKSLLEYLDNVLGSVHDDSNWSFIISLKNLVEKMSLKKAESKLTDRILNRTLSIKSSDEIVAVFGNKD